MSRAEKVIAAHEAMVRLCQQVRYVRQLFLEAGEPLPTFLQTTQLADQKPEPGNLDELVELVRRT